MNQEERTLDIRGGVVVFVMVIFAALFFAWSTAVWAVWNCSTVLSGTRLMDFRGDGCRIRSHLAMVSLLIFVIMPWSFAVEKNEEGKVEYKFKLGGKDESS